MRLPIPQILNGLWQEMSVTKFKVKCLREFWGPHRYSSLPPTEDQTSLRLPDRVQPWLPGSHDYGGCCNHWQQDCDLSLFQNEEMKGKKRKWDGMEKWMTTTEREQEIVRRIKEIRCLSCLCFWAFSLLIPQWSISLLNCCSSVTTSAERACVGPKLDRGHSHGLEFNPLHLTTNPWSDKLNPWISWKASE